MDSQTKYKSQGIILKILRLSLLTLEARPAMTHQPVISAILAVTLIIQSTKTTILITIKVSIHPYQGIERFNSRPIWPLPF